MLPADVSGTIVPLQNPDGLEYVFVWSPASNLRMAAIRSQRGFTNCSEADLQLLTVNCQLLTVNCVGHDDHSVRLETMCAGTPTATAWAGTSARTTAPAPTTA